MHFIVESEQKVVGLIGALDMALEELDAMEAKLDAYHQYIAVSTFSVTFAGFATFKFFCTGFYLKDSFLCLLYS